MSENQRIARYSCEISARGEPRRTIYSLSKSIAATLLSRIHKNAFIYIFLKIMPDKFFSAGLDLGFREALLQGEIRRKSK